MKRVVIFALLVVGLDAGIGWAIGQLYRRTFTGERGGLLNYALTKDVDVLILGSSRAQFQVMPAVLRQTLSMTAFNAGLKGHDFLYSVMLYDLWRRAHIAKVLLLQIDIESLLRRDNELEASQIFAPYIDESAVIREVLYSGDPFKRFEYRSQTYRYNGKVFAIARNWFARPDFESDGFLPAFGTLNPATDLLVANALDQDATAREKASQSFWDTKLKYLRALAADATGRQTRLFLFHTPQYGPDPIAHSTWTDRVRSLISELPGVEFLDICETTYPQIFARRPALFRDVNHLNAEGAVILSSLLADEMKRRLAAGTDTSHERTARSREEASSEPFPPQ